MKKYIEVIVKQEKNNQKVVKRVTRGYAFNYLIPNHMAEVPTKGQLKHLQMLDSISKHKKDQTNKLDQQINNDIMKIQMIHIKKKCGNNGQIFGSILEQDIQEIIHNTIGKKIEKKQILIDNIKQLGTYMCYISVNEKIKNTIKLRILPSHI